MKRILVTSSRDWADAPAVLFALAKAGQGHKPSEVTVVHGACPTGGDLFADQAAARLGYNVERYPADWDTYGKRAGVIRNGDMVTQGADECHAFVNPCRKPWCKREPKPHDSHGTANCMELAEKASIPVTPHRPRREGVAAHTPALGVITPLPLSRL